MKNFVLIGAAGYIAPRHLKAIKETGNNLLAALDPHDSVGILDQYFPNAHFFTEFERFDRHCEKLKREGVNIDYVSVCSPNYLHDAHIRFGLRIGADVICEKPVVLNPWNVDALLEMEKETGKKVYMIHQLRLHPVIQELKTEVESNPGKFYDINLQYITPRGHWYQHSWKGDIQKSGGIATNIGLHFFDMLLWIFGPVKESNVKVHDEVKAAGLLKLEKATVSWFLSISEIDLPKNRSERSKNSFRSLTVDGKDYTFSEGLDDLHTLSYSEIFHGNGASLRETFNVITLVHELRQFIIK